MKITADSHTDHNLTPAHLAWILERFGSRNDSFLIDCAEMPDSLGALPCGLHGPLMGDPPVDDDQVFLMARKGRARPSRLVNRSPRPSRILTIVLGHHEGECILFTAYAGPAAPREVCDPTLSPEQLVESRAFWAEHALSADGATAVGVAMTPELSSGEVRAVVALRAALKRQNRAFDACEGPNSKGPPAQHSTAFKAATRDVDQKIDALKGWLLGCPDGSSF